MSKIYEDNLTCSAHVSCSCHIICCPTEFLINAKNSLKPNSEFRLCALIWFEFRLSLFPVLFLSFLFPFIFLLKLNAIEFSTKSNWIFNPILNSIYFILFPFCLICSFFFLRFLFLFLPSFFLLLFQVSFLFHIPLSFPFLIIKVF